MIGIVALAWNSFGAFDYTMTQMRNQEYLKMYNAEQMAYIEGFPAWAVAGWAVGVWGGVVGSVLLLLRKKLAAPVYLASLAGAVVSHFYSMVLSNGLEMAGGGAMVIFPIVIVLVALGLWLYARAMAKKGVLA